MKCERTDSTQTPWHQSSAEGKYCISKCQVNLSFLFCRLQNSNCTLRFPFKAADRVTHHPHWKCLYWKNERVFFSWNIWIRCPGRADSAANRLKAKCLLMGKHLVPRKTLIRFSSLICLDCPTLVSAAMTKKSCSKTPLPVFVYRNKTEPAQGKQPKETSSCVGREGTFHTHRRNICHGQTQDILDRCSNSTGLPIPPKWCEIPQTQDSCDSSLPRSFEWNQVA